MCDRQIAITPYKTAHIDGHTWLVEHWNTWGNGTTWRYVAYVSPTCGTHPWKLNLSHIFMDAVRAGDLKLTYYLVEIPFGPETYSGGAGFGLHYYDVEGVR